MEEHNAYFLHWIEFYERLQSETKTLSPKSVIETRVWIFFWLTYQKNCKFNKQINSHYEILDRFVFGSACGVSTGSEHIHGIVFYSKIVQVKNSLSTIVYFSEIGQQHTST
jgi:hypothetical protein